MVTLVIRHTKNGTSIVGSLSGRTSKRDYGTEFPVVLPSLICANTINNLGLPGVIMKGIPTLNS